ncbi:MAG: DUF1330 domain-containing protein [Planctomycetes bacterium]|nr:DUF1330 domain-containing protein [Planctomycetota bacterium]
MSDKKVLLLTLALPNPDEKEALQQYQQGAGPLFAKHGGKGLGKIAIAENFVGDNPAAFLGIAEFPSAKAVKGLFSSEDYQKLVPARDKGLKALNLYISQPDQVVPSLEGDNKSLLITMAAPANMEALQQYQQGAGPLSAKHSGKGLGKIAIAENFVGDNPAAFLSIAEFPSNQAIKDFFNDEAYQPLIPMREKALSSLNLYIAS